MKAYSWQVLCEGTNYNIEADEWSRDDVLKFKLKGEVVATFATFTNFIRYEEVKE